MSKKKTESPEVVKRSDDELAELEKATPTEQEVINEAGEPDGFPTFIAEINGEEVELEDQFRGDRTPGALMMVGKTQYMAKYMPGLLEQILGEDQVITVLEAGADVQELAGVVSAWAKHRGMGND